jgi:hypothetical protein
MNAMTTADLPSFDMHAPAHAATTVPVYNVDHEVRLQMSNTGLSGQAIHADVALMRVAGVVSVRVRWTWYAAMGRERARAAFVDALRQGPRRDGALRGSRAFLRAVAFALAEGASVE